MSKADSLLGRTRLDGFHSNEVFQPQRSDDRFGRRDDRYQYGRRVAFIFWEICTSSPYYIPIVRRGATRRKSRMCNARARRSCEIIPRRNFVCRVVAVILAKMFAEV